jgi:hypothetical protein
VRDAAQAIKTCRLNEIGAKGQKNLVQTSSKKKHITKLSRNNGRTLGNFRMTFISLQSFCWAAKSARSTLAGPAAVKTGKESADQVPEGADVPGE